MEQENRQVSGHGSPPPKRLPILGVDNSTIDPKGRVLITKKKRERLGERFVMVQDPKGCLLVYPQDVFYDLVDKVRDLDQLNPIRMDFIRDFMSTAEDDMTYDVQGRFVVPIEFRTAAKLKKDVKIVGAVDYIEIWATEEFEKYKADRKNYAKEERMSLAETWAQIQPK